MPVPYGVVVAIMLLLVVVAVVLPAVMLLTTVGVAIDGSGFDELTAIVVKLT